MVEVSDVMDAVARVEAMSDKVAAFAIVQNLAWVLASLKGDLKSWIRDQRPWFIYGALGALVIYAAPGIWLHGLERSLLIGHLTSPAWQADSVLFCIREAGIVVACGTAAFAFWGVSRPSKAASTAGSTGQLSAPIDSN